MKKTIIDYSTFKKDLLKDQQIKIEYDKLQADFAYIEAIIQLRKNRGFSQKQLAKIIGTKQTAISRLESGRANPSLKFLQKLARALDKNLQLQFC